MTDLFLKLLNMSISASWLVLVVLVLRFLLKKAPKWIHCLLWAMVAVRLICPFSFESSMSLIPAREEVTMESLRSTIDMEVHVAGETVAEVPPSSDTSASLPAKNQSTGHNDTPLTGTILPNLTAVWFAGMSLMIVYALESYWKIRKKVDISIDLGDGVCICDYIDSPFILGIVKPRICLPSTLSPADAAHVLAHERSHLKRRDHWWKPLGYILLAVYWFNPLVWAAYVLLCRDIELACDERVVKKMDIPDKKAYSEALLNCSVPRRMIAACPLAFGEVGVKERVKSVLNYQKPAFWIIAVAIIVCIVTSICFLTDPKEPEEDPIPTTEIIAVSASIDTEAVQALRKQFPELKLFDWNTVAEELGATELTMFGPQTWGNTLFVGCQYDDGYGLACLEQTKYGHYELKQVFSSQEQIATANDQVAGFNYVSEAMDVMVYVCWNEEITAMEWAYGYWDYILVNSCPGLILVDKANWLEHFSGGEYVFQYELAPSFSYDLAENLSAVRFSDGKKLYMFSSMAVNYENLPRPGYLSPTYEELQELLDILKRLPMEDITPGHITESTRLSVSLTLDNGLSGIDDTEYMGLNYDGSAVDLTLSAANSETKFAFHISNPELNGFLETLCAPDRLESSIILYDTTPIQYTYGYANMEIQPLVNWEYEIVEYTNDDTPFGIRGRPKYCDGGWIFLSFWPNGFDPLDGVAYSYGSNTNWTYHRIEGLPGDYVLLNEGADAWLEEHETEILTHVLDPERLAVGIPTLAQVQEVAQKMYPGVSVEEMAFEFDWTAGTWIIYPYEATGAPPVILTIDAYGNIVSVASYLHREEDAVVAELAESRKRERIDSAEIQREVERLRIVLAFLQEEMQSVSAEG